MAGPSNETQAPPRPSHANDAPPLATAGALMRVSLRRAAIAVVLGLGLAFLWMVRRAAVLSPRRLSVAPLDTAPVDAERVADALARAIRHQTISRPREAPAAEALEALQAELSTLFPRVHALLDSAIAVLIASVTTALAAPPSEPRASVERSSRKRRLDGRSGQRIGQARRQAARHDGPMNAQSEGPTSREPDDIVSQVELLARSAEQRWQLLAAAQREMGLDPDAPVSPAAGRGPRERALELRDHTRSFLLPRARDLDAPLLVAIVGPTGSGKSTLINTLAGAAVSQPGVLRPTTRVAVAVGSAADLERAIDTGPLAGLSADRFERHVADILPGLVVVDTPDVDSVEHAGRALANRLLEAADVGLFVTTATRYADRVPWDVLERAEQRRLDLMVIINRMPAREDARVVREGIESLLAKTELRVRGIIGVPDGALAEDGASLTPSTIAPLSRWLTTLSADAVERRSLASEALAGALRGVAPLSHAVADDVDGEIQVGKTLLRVAQRAYTDENAAMVERLFSGSLLREEVLRNWHSFVGADQVTRLFSRGVGQAREAGSALLRRIPRVPITAVQLGGTDDSTLVGRARGTLRSLRWRSAREPAAALQRDVTDDITALVTNHAAEAARRTSQHWSADPIGAQFVAAHPDLWSCSPGLGAQTRDAIDAWVASIAQDVAARGAGRRKAARVAALGVNTVAVSVMLVTFSFTGGISGAEAGIAAATAVLTQKLLNALFGEAAVQEMVARARRRLRDALGVLFQAEQRRFEERLGDIATRERLADELRSLAA